MKIPETPTIQVPEVLPVGCCQCGCGLLAPIAPKTSRHKGWVKGAPKRFINGHQNRRQDLRAEFYSLVNKNGPTIRPELGPCWLWLGSRNRQGYGWIRVNGRTRLAHQVALEFEGYYRILAPFGKQQVGHLCDTPECVRVSHLKIWTPQDDADDKRSKDRQTRGERHHSAKLRQQDVDEIRRLYAVGVPQGALVRRFGVDQTTIRRILRGETWRT
jgi:hypothetical protein